MLSSKLGEHDARAKRIDKVAHVRFASVYRSFEDVDELPADPGHLSTQRRDRREAPRGTPPLPPPFPSHGIVKSVADSYSASHGHEARHGRRAASTVSR